MAIKFKDIVKPSDFDTRLGLGGSNLGKSELETVASNIIVIARKRGDRWAAFTFEDYKAACSPRTDFTGEEAVLDQLVQRSVLSKVDDTYSVTESFFRVLAPFIKAE